MKLCKDMHSPSLLLSSCLSESQLSNLAFREWQEEAPSSPGVSKLGAMNHLSTNSVCVLDNVLKTDNFFWWLILDKSNSTVSLCEVRTRADWKSFARTISS